MIRSVGTAVVLFVLFASHLMGQAHSSLQGTITDSTGAVVPGVGLTLTNTASQATRSTISLADGSYSFAQVVPGSYELRATASGFSDVLVSELRLLVNQPATQNVQFQQIGSASDSVSVSAELTPLNISDASLGNAVGSKPILQLPFDARNVVGLLALQPGVLYVREDDSSSQDVSDARSGNVNGSRNDQSNITLDGIDVNDQTSRYPFTSVLRVTLDSVQEFRTTTLNATAEQGRSSGAQIAMITKSGTNNVHGSAYWFHRNNATSANDYFLKASQLASGAENTPPKLIRNVGGVSLGGPIVKNRWFLFGNWEHRRDASDEVQLRWVPTAEMRQGILRYPDSNGNIVSVSPQQLASAVDPRGVNQAVLAELQKYPLPNSASVGDGYNVSGYRFVSPIGLRWNTYTAKSDFHIDQEGRHHLFVRGNLQNDRESGAAQYPGQISNNTDLNNSKGIATGLTSVISSSFVNDFRYGLTRQGVESSGIATSPLVLFRSLSSYTGTNRSSRSLIPVHALSNTSTWVKGNHTLSFGTQLRFIRNNRLNTGNSFSSAVINSSYLESSGAALSAPFTNMNAGFVSTFRDAAATVLGLVTQGEARYNYLVDGTALPEGAPVHRDFHNNEYELFVSDSWRIRPNLTLTAGLRWSLMPPIEEANGQQLASDLPLSSWFGLRAYLAEQGRPQSEAPSISYINKSDPRWRSLYPYHKKNFAPRLGIAWSPTFQSGLGRFLFGEAGKTSIRAGAGMFYDNMGQSIMQRADAFSFGLSTSVANRPGQLTVANAPRFTSVNQIPGSLLAPAPPAGFPVTFPNSGSIESYVDDSIVPPYAMTLNFNIGRDFGRGMFLQAGYVGRLGRRLLSQADLAMPTNLKDAASGQTYFDAATTLARLGLAGTAVSSVPALPFFENNYSNLAGGGLTATQAAYQYFSGSAPDYTGALWAMDTFLGGPASGPNSQVNAQYSSLAAWRNMGNSDYHALQLNARKQWMNGDLVDFNYTFSKSIDLSSMPERSRVAGSMIANPWNPRLFRAVSDFDTTHQISASAVYGLPFGKGQRFLGDANGFVDAVLGGWQLATVLRTTSGFPIAPGNGFAWPTNWQSSGNARVVGELPETGSYTSAAGNPNIFRNPAAAYAAFEPELPGGVGVRNVLRGDGVFQWDTNLAKSFEMPWAEGHRLQFRWEAYNLLNTVRFDVYGMSMNLSMPGTFGNYSRTLNQPRTMQFGLRYDF